MPLRLETLIFKKLPIKIFVFVAFFLPLFIEILYAAKAIPVSKEGQEIFNEAESFLLARRYDEAMAKFKKLLIVEPDFEGTSFYLGEAYLGKGFFDEAIYWYREAIELNPDNSLAWRKLANAYELKGDLTSAAKNYYICLQIDPRDIEAQYALDDLKKRLSEQASKPTGQVNVAPIAPGEQEISSIFFYVKHNPNKWRITISEKSIDNTKVSVQLESLNLKDKNKKTVIINVRLYAEKLKDTAISSVQYADMIAGEQRSFRYYIIYREQPFEKFNAVKDIFSMKKEGRLFKGISMFLVKNGVGFYLTSLGPAEYYEDIKNSFQEFLKNLSLNF